MDVPATDYRTATAIKHDRRTKVVSVTFVLRDHDASAASYAAVCPRCGTGEILVSVKLAADGTFAEAPACPTLCIACEDALDAMLEPEAASGPGDQTGDREALSKHLRAMNVRAWD